MAKRTAQHLTRREREIIHAIFALNNRASAEEIRARLSDPPSDSSVRVMLTRLENKGLVRHDRPGPSVRVLRNNVAGRGKADSAAAGGADLLWRIIRSDGGLRSCAKAPGATTRSSRCDLKSNA